jgi:hypothetical protein
MCTQDCIAKGFHLMNRNRYVGSIIFTILVIFGPHYFANGQGKPRPKTRPRPPATSPAPASNAAASKVPVIVNFKDGKHINGLFLGADTETVQVLVRSKKTSIKMSEVFSIVFETDETDAEAPSKSIEEVVKNLESDGTDPTLPVARKAYNSLRRLAEAIEVRVPYSQYSAQLFEAKTVVDEAAGVLPDGAVKIDLKHALEVFTDAARAWGAVQQQYGPYAGRIPINAEPGSSLMQKYRIKPELNAVAQADHLKLDTALKTILAAAEQILRNIDLVLGQ